MAAGRTEAELDYTVAAMLSARPWPSSDNSESPGTEVRLEPRLEHSAQVVAGKRDFGPIYAGACAWLAVVAVVGVVNAWVVTLQGLRDSGVSTKFPFFLPIRTKPVLRATR